MFYQSTMGKFVFYHKSSTNVKEDGTCPMLIWSLKMMLACVLHWNSHRTDIIISWLMVYLWFLSRTKVNSRYVNWNDCFVWAALYMCNKSRVEHMQHLFAIVLHINFGQFTDRTLTNRSIHLFYKQISSQTKV